MLASLRAYLELVRLPNLFTAAADVLAGYFTIAALRDGGDGQELTWLVLATVCLYGGGVVLNDYFDTAVDQVERPERPIPSGRVSRGGARRFAVGLLVMAGLCAASVGPISLALALGIAFAAVFYDAVGKRTALGPLNMGLCRFLNLLLGVSAVPALLVDRVPLALLLMVHVTGVTVLSRGEVRGGQRGASTAMLGALSVVVVGMCLLGLSGALPDRAYLPFLVAFLVLVGAPALRAYADPAPANVGRAVKWGVLGLVLLDASFAAAFAGPEAGIVVAALLVPSAVIARLFAVT